MGARWVSVYDWLFVAHRRSRTHPIGGTLAAGRQTDKEFSVANGAVTGRSSFRPPGCESATVLVDVNGGGSVRRRAAWAGCCLGQHTKDGDVPELLHELHLIKPAVPKQSI